MFLKLYSPVRPFQQICFWDFTCVCARSINRRLAAASTLDGLGAGITVSLDHLDFSNMNTKPFEPRYTLHAFKKKKNLCNKEKKIIFFYFKQGCHCRRPLRAS